MITLTARVLANPDEVVASGDSTPIARVAPELLGITLAGGALFGLLVGSLHGSVQPLFAAVKMPILLLVPAFVTLPAVYALRRATGVEVSWTRLSLAALVGMARSALIAAALGPVVWLFYSMRPDYHVAVLVLVAAIATAAIPGIAVVSRSVPKGGDLRVLALIGGVLVFCLAFAQTGWLLRPFVARPNATATLFRPVEEDVFSSVLTTARSAAGDYSGWDVESRGLFSRPSDDESQP